MIEHIQVIPDKCRACRRCEVACIAAHHGMTFKEAMKHRDVLVSRVQVVKAEGFKTTVRCHQCNPAPCCNICPTGALQQEEDGRITMRVQLCVACKMCIAVCPYGTISLDTIGMPEEGGETMAQRSRREVAVRCDMCKAWREENGKKITACMEACPVHALSMVEPDGTIIEAPKPEKKKPAAAEERARAHRLHPSRVLTRGKRETFLKKGSPSSPSCSPISLPKTFIRPGLLPAVGARESRGPARPEKGISRTKIREHPRCRMIRGSGDVPFFCIKQPGLKPAPPVPKAPW